MYAIKTQRYLLLFFLQFNPPHGNKFQMIKIHHQMKKITPLFKYMHVQNVQVLAIYIKLARS